VNPVHDVKDGSDRDRRNRSVFINCPYDALYQQYQDALVFAVVCCGLEPRMAPETDDTDEDRIKRIEDALLSSRFSIHDLSRSKGEGKNRLARLNMAFELGIAHGVKVAARQMNASTPHYWTAVVDKTALIERAFSDLNGRDLKQYESPRQLITMVMSWLVTRVRDVEVNVTSSEVIKALPFWEDELRELRAKWPESSPPWHHVIDAARKVAVDKALLPPPPDTRT